MTNIELVKQALYSGLIEKKIDIDSLSHFFDLDYIQTTDGKTTDFAQFSAHMVVLHQKITIEKLEFVTLMQEDNKVFSRHMVTVKRQDESIGKIEVMAVFEIKNQKIINCNELTHSFNKIDKNLGSIS